MLKKIYTVSLMTILSSLSFSAQADTYYISGYENIPPYDGKSYNADLSEKHLTYYPNLRTMIDPESFRVIEERYSVDKNSVYYQSIVIEEADPKTFASLNTYLNRDNHYAKDKNSIFLEGKVVEQADPTTFKLVASLTEYGRKYVYAIDKTNLFINGELIPNADVSTFRVFDNTIAQDKNRVYYRDKALEESDPKTFKQITREFSKDKGQVYYGVLTIPNLDPDTFVIVDESRPIIKDQKNVYYIKYGSNFILWEDMDAPSFESIGIGYYKDNNNFYASDGKTILKNNGQKYEVIDSDRALYLKVGSECFNNSNLVSCP